MKTTHDVEVAAAPVVGAAPNRLGAGAVDAVGFDEPNENPPLAAGAAGAVVAACEFVVGAEDEPPKRLKLDGAGADAGAGAGVVVVAPKSPPPAAAGGFAPKRPPAAGAGNPPVEPRAGVDVPLEE